MSERSALSRSIPHARGKRTAILVAALVLCGALIVVVALGFRGRHIRRNEARMTAPVMEPKTRL